MKDSGYVIPKVIFLLLLGGYSLFFLTAPMLRLGDTSTFMHLVNLIFHEAGHVLLAWTPPVLHALGGTLGQLAMPLALGFSFALKNRDGYAASVAAWWFGQSLVDVAPYINDARASRLILLGGATGTDIEGHDWMFLLGEWNLLDHDVRIARLVLIMGRIVMVLALFAALTFAARPWWHRRSPATA